MVILSVLETAFPLLPLWLILKDNNVQLGTIPVVLTIACAVFIGVGRHARNQILMSEERHVNFIRLGIIAGLQEVRDSLRRIEEDVSHLRNN